MATEAQKVSALSMRLHNRQIGILNRLAGDQQIFAFDEDYVRDPQRPTLSLSFKGTSGGLVTAARPVTRRVPPFFSNLLPEGHLRDYLARRAGVHPEREFFLLAALGADLPGAVTAVPLDAVGEAAVEPAPQRQQVARPDEPLHFSLAGVQLKFSAVSEPAGGLTIPAHGAGGDWIVKLPSAHFAAVPENEFAMLELARAVGITVPETRLVAVADIQGLPEQSHTLGSHALAIRRFDRLAGGTRVHMEDFAQVFGEFPERKYEHHSYANIAAVLFAEIGEPAIHEFFRRLVFSVLIGNGDMHLKNWTLLYPDRRTLQLSPAYDFVSTVAYMPGEQLALNFGGSRSLSAITTDQLRRLADTARIPASPLPKLAREIAARTTAVWPTLAAASVLPASLHRAITDHLAAAAGSIV